MPLRRGRDDPDPPTPPERSVLKIPKSEAEAKLQDQIRRGRTLATSPVPSLEADPRRGTSILDRRRGTNAELETLRRHVGEWRDYNQAWLDANLDGEAADEYRTASQHVHVRAFDHAADLQDLRDDIDAEVSKLQSVHDRLDLWLPPGHVTPSDDPSQPAASSPTPQVNDIEAAIRPAGGEAITHAVNPKAVMVIYGHDTEANDALFDWLSAVGLEPREWTQLVQATGSGSPYIGQVLDRAFTQAQAVVAFFTPDEFVIGTAADSSDPNAWRLQARPNVLIEAGMAFITHPKRTVLVVLGDLELPSDLAGRHYVRLSHTDTGALHDLASRLHAAGCDTNTTGDRWLNSSRFSDRTRASCSPIGDRPAGPPKPGSQRREQAESEAQAKVAERRTREDSDARQVVVIIKKVLDIDNATHLITVSTPNTYPIKQVESQIAWQANNGGLAMANLGFGGDPFRPVNARVHYTFRASINPQIRNPEPIIRFVDQHGNRYYQFRLHTQRFPGDTDWIRAAQDIDLWLRTGPNPD